MTIKMSYSNQAVDSRALYRYASLQEPTHIRILHLEPGNYGDPLHCTIEHVDVDSGVTFSAISYVWGNEETPYGMLVGDDQYVPLTTSLHEAFQNLRAVEDIGTKTFWADQVCINQSDTKERNLQVAMMGSIYRKATRVITYIGPDTTKDHEGIRLMRIFDQLWRYIEDLDSHPNSVEVQSLLKCHLPEEEDLAWDGYRSLINRAWSTRVWMIQENVLNDNTIMLCGKIAFPWTAPRTKDFYTLFENFPERSKFALPNRDLCILRSEIPSLMPMASIGQLLYLRAWVSENGCNSLPLLDVLRLSRNFACKDPRDRVYALLGLASNLDVLQIDPDYQKSPAEILTDTALRILWASSNLDLLNHVGNAGEIELPSWAPDWSPPKSRYLLKPCVFVTEAEHQASANTIPIWDFDADHSVLTVHGAIIDSVQCSAGDPSINASLLAQDPDLALVEYPRMMEVLGKICGDSIYHVDSNNVPAELIDHLSRTIIADRPLRGESEGAGPSACFLACLKIWKYRYQMALFRANGGSQPWRQPDITTQAKGSKFSNYSIVAEGRSLCMTQSGRLCLAPSKTRIGDSVAIFYGGKTAYILRPVGDDFELLGEAYVHGLMKGEALNEPTFHSKVRKLKLR